MIHRTNGPPRTQAALSAAPTYQLRLRDGRVGAEVYRTSDTYLIRFPTLADFDVSLDGGSIASWPAPETDAAMLEHLYLNQVLPLALSRQGVPSYHGSAVTIGEGAIAFLGLSGMGKSTLAAAFVTTGAAFLTDDGLQLDSEPGACVVRPSHPSLRLWADSADALVSHEAPLDLGTDDRPKQRVLASDTLRHCPTPVPLLAAFVLHDDGVAAPQIAPLEGAVRLRAWIANSFLLDPTDRALLAQHFDWTHTVSQRVPTFTLDYPRRYDMLPAVREAIMDHCAALAARFV